MKELSPRAQALIDAARNTDGPSQRDRERVKARLAAAIGVTAFGAAASAAASSASAAAASSASTTLAGGAAASELGFSAAASGAGATAAGAASAAIGGGAAASGVGAAATVGGAAAAAGGWVAALGAKGAAWVGAAALSAVLGTATTTLVTMRSVEDAPPGAAERARIAPPATTHAAAITAEAARPGFPLSPEPGSVAPSHEESVEPPSAAAQAPADTRGSRRAGARVKSPAASRTPSSLDTTAGSVEPTRAASTSETSSVLGSTTATLRPPSGMAVAAQGSEPIPEDLVPEPTLQPASATPVAPREQTPRAVAKATSAATSVTRLGNSATPAHAPSNTRLQRAAAPQLEAELDLLARAQRALHQGKLPLALDLLDQHASQHANGSLRQERLAARAVVLCRMHNTRAGNAEAARLATQTPRSPLLSWVRTSCKR